VPQSSNLSVHPRLPGCWPASIRLSIRAAASRVQPADRSRAVISTRAPRRFRVPPALTGSRAGRGPAEESVSFPKLFCKGDEDVKNFGVCGRRCCWRDWHACCGKAQGSRRKAACSDCCRSEESPRDTHVRSTGAGPAGPWDQRQGLRSLCPLPTWPLGEHICWRVGGGCKASTHPIASF
jgi:hypothetical protein